MLDNRSQWMQVVFHSNLPGRDESLVSQFLCVYVTAMLCHAKASQDSCRRVISSPKQNILARLILKWQYFVSNHKTTCMLAIARPLPVPDLRHKTRSPSGKRNSPKTKEHEAVVICIVHAVVTSIIIRSLRHMGGKRVK
jgi:hypothetical protein